MTRWRIFLAVIILAGIAVALVMAARQMDRPPPGETALFSSLPIMWSESDDPAILLRGDAAPHWARRAIEARGRLRPLDVLAPIPAGPDLLVMAQPRPLSPDENVALDAWVRGGGRVLLFADPMLTRHSAYGIGDRRRPQDVALLSPILARWGLRLEFVQGQSAGERRANLLGVDIPVNLPGQFAALSGQAACALDDGGLVARCRVGKGHVLAVADAALLDEAGAAPGDAALRTAALSRLMALALDD